MRRFTVLFFVLSLWVYVGKASNVTTFAISSNINSYKFDFKDIECYSLVCNHDNMLFISSNHGILIFDGSAWFTLATAEHFLLTSGNDNIVYLAGNTGIGKIIFNPEGLPFIEKIAHYDAGQAWVLPDAFYVRNKRPTIRVGNQVFQVQEDKLVEKSSAVDAFHKPQMMMEPGFQVHLHDNGNIDVIDQLTKAIFPVTTNFNPENLPVIGTFQDRNHTIWILFRDAVKRLDLFGHASFFTPSAFSSVSVKPAMTHILKNDLHQAILLELRKKHLLPDSILADIDGNIWVRSHTVVKDHAYIFMIPASLKKALHLLEVNYQDLGLSDVSAIIPLCDGTIELVGKEGMIIFQTRKYLHEKREYSVGIYKMTEDGGKIITQDYLGIENRHPYISVNATVETITFYFGAFDLRGKNKLLFSTYLEGHDAVWSDWKDTRSVSVGYLSNGDYRLHVRALSNNGFVSPETTIPFTVEASLFNRWWSWSIYTIVFLILMMTYWVRRKISLEKENEKLEFILNERTAELMSEKAKTDDLLANLLPKDTADELKNTGKATSQKYNMVTVLFSDIQGFTKIAEEMNPEKLIDELDNFFFHFDSVVEKYNIEKIKTIGDAYMCAGGIPYKNRTNPVEVVLAALEMQDYMKQLRQKNVNIWDLRIGVHTGAVIAGVVGHKRVSYDIWGDTVNTASRMESSGEVGKVNISGHTYEMIKDFFICEYRGRMPVKYKGDIDMFFVKAIRPELSIDLKVIPNRSFFIQLQILRLQDLEEFILQKIADELPPTIAFHNARHTKDVYSVVELIGRAESLSSEDMLMVRTAALLLNLGYCGNYKDHILNSIHAAEVILPKFKYTLEQILIVNQLINATNTRYNHTGKMESILIDAYNNYIGRVDYLFLSIDLFQEVKQHNGGMTEKEWFNQQVRFLEQFAFYTGTANLLREVSAEEQILKIKEYAKID